jgi:phage gp29-like protein
MAKPITNEIASIRKDHDIFTGWLNYFQNPDPVLLYESGGKGIKLYDEVARDAHASSVLQTRYLAVVGREWEVLPADAGKKKGRTPTVTQEQKIADFVKAAFLATNFDQFRFELLSATLYGFYAAEIIWKTTKESVLPERIRAKHPRRFIFTPDRELRLLTMSNMVEGDPLPPQKFIIHTFGSSDNPYGTGLGQRLWWPVWFKKNGIKFWMIFLEKFGQPTVIGKYPLGTAPGDQDKLIDAIDAIQNDTGIAIPENMAIELMEAARSGDASYESMCEYMDKQISKVVLGQTATTEGTPGRLGGDDVQNAVRLDLVKADADLLCETLNNSLVKWLVDFNFPGVTEYPKLWIRCESEKDLKSLADRDRILSKEIGLPMGKQYFYDTYAVPIPDEGDEIVTPAPEPTQPAGTGGPGFAEFATALRKKAATPKGQQDVDDIALKATVAGMDAIDVLLQQVVKRVNNAKSYEELGEAIYDLYPALDTDDFQELLARAMTASAMTGYGAAGEEK